MREIILRGKDRVSHEWVQVNVLNDLNVHAKLDSFIAGTISEYTDLIDYSGTKIFVGDILSFHGSIEEVYAVMKFCHGKYICVGENNFEISFPTLGYVVGNVWDNEEYNFTVNEVYS